MRHSKGSAREVFREFAKNIKGTLTAQPPENGPEQRREERP